MKKSFLSVLVLVSFLSGTAHAGDDAKISTLKVGTKFQINKMLMIENSKTEYDSSNIYFIGFIEGKAYRPVQERMGILHCLAAILQIMVKKL